MIYFTHCSEDIHVKEVHSPLIVVEVLSPGTMVCDCAEKFARYMLCSTLEVYILASQDEQYMEIYCKSTGWKQERFASEEIIKLGQLDLEWPLASVYEGVF